MKASENPKVEITERRVPPGRARRFRSASTNSWRELHLKNILVPTDFSDPSKKALSYAANFAKKVGSQITLLHVIEPLPAYSDIVDPVILGSDYWSRESNAAFQKFCKESHVAPSLLRETLIREGAPHHEITEAARELKSDLIIIATNGRTGLAHVLLGSTTERVVRHAPCPVLVVREKEREIVRSGS